MTADESTCERFPVYEHLTDLIEDTLRPKPNNSNSHQRYCLLTDCLMSEEQCFEEHSLRVKWQAFQYITNESTNVVKETSPGEMFNHLKSLLELFNRSLLLCSRLFRELLVPAPGSASDSVLLADKGLHPCNYPAQACHNEH